jgi:hypothetical protein
MTSVSVMETSRRPAIKYKEIVETEKTPEGVLLRRKIVVVDAKTEKVIRELCLPCDDPLYQALGYGGPDCVCKEPVGTVEVIVLPTDKDDVLRLRIQNGGRF